MHNFLMLTIHPNYFNVQIIRPPNVLQQYSSDQFQSKTNLFEIIFIHSVLIGEWRNIEKSCTYIAKLDIMISVLISFLPFIFILCYNNKMKRVALLFILLAIALSDTCGGNCQEGDCTVCFCGAQKNIVDIDTWCGKYTWNKACCKCIVSHQSGGNAHRTTHNENGSTNVGLWQINTVNWNSCSGGSAPCDPNTNLNCATALYKASGNNWKAWKSHSTCGC